MFDTVGSIIDYETGALDFEGTMDLFSRLIATGQAWSLQGHYGRTAKHLIDSGYIDPDGTVNWDTIEMALVS